MSQFTIRPKNCKENIALQLVNVKSKNVTIKKIGNKITSA